MNSILELIPAVMGLPTISEHMDALMEAMRKSPIELGEIMGWAKVVGLCIALGVGGNECFQMMLGRRGLDVMKLVHIVIISMCISSAGWIASAAQMPGQILETKVKGMADAINDEVATQEAKIAKLQESYIDKVREQMYKLEENKQAQDKADIAWYNVAGQYKAGLEELGQLVQHRIKEWTLLAETKICEWVNTIIRVIGEILFQVAYYGLIICQRIFITILSAFGPLMFALSLSPHYKSAWSQWLSKLISVSLWGFVAYVCVYYVDFIMLQQLQSDVTSYNTLIGSVETEMAKENANIGAIGLQAIGTTCMYVVGLLIGVRALAMVPEVASWLIPGGVSSGAGASAAGVATGAGMAAGAVGGMAAGKVYNKSKKVGSKALKLASKGATMSAG